MRWWKIEQLTHKKHYKNMWDLESSQQMSGARCDCYKEEVTGQDVGFVGE